MADQKQPPQLFEQLLFPRLFQAFRLAIQPSKLVIALLGLTVIYLAGQAMDLSRTVVVAPPAEEIGSELDVYMTSPSPHQAVLEYRRQYQAKGLRTGVFSTLWSFGSQKFHAALRELFDLKFTGVARNIVDYFKALGWAFRYHYAYCLVFAVIKLAVIAVVGGAVCRMAALQLARGEKPGPIQALRFSVKRFTSLLFAPLLPVAILVVLGVPIGLVGLAGNIPWAGELIVGIFSPLVLALGLCMAVALVGAVAGFNLMFPAVAYDGLDAFDAIGSSFSYVFNRPWRMAFYTALAAVYGAVCYIVVRFFAFLLILVAHTTLSLCLWKENPSGVNKLSAIWPEPRFMNLLGLKSAAPASWTESVAAVVVYGSLWVVAAAVVSVVITFYFSANTIIYSLLRHKVDNAALDDVYIESRDLESRPAAATSLLSSQASNNCR